jgi:hypothetical protein
MYPVGDVVLWSATPAALVVLAAAVGAYGLTHRQAHPQEDPVESAYRNAKAQAAKSVQPGPVESSPRRARVGARPIGQASP